MICHKIQTKQQTNKQTKHPQGNWVVVIVKFPSMSQKQMVKVNPIQLEYDMP